MKVNILTLYSQIFPGSLGISLIGKALDKGIFELNVINLRDYTSDLHKTVDDSPFGGGAGMVMKPEIIDKALTQLQPKKNLFYLSPRGKIFNQKMAENFSQQQEITFICGRFEGVDQRVLDKWSISEISLGDFVLSGGEPALLVMLDAVFRLIPGVLGNQESLKEESFSNGLLEYPQYTQPQDWQGRKVPEVLLSGHHENIRKWRLNQAEILTREKRPDLWQLYKNN